jgi:hypothetical protein
LGAFDRSSVTSQQQLVTQKQQQLPWPQQSPPQSSNRHDGMHQWQQHRDEEIQQQQAAAAAAPPKAVVRGEWQAPTDHTFSSSRRPLQPLPVHAHQQQQRSIDHLSSTASKVRAAQHPATCTGNTSSCEMQGSAAGGPASDIQSSWRQHQVQKREPLKRTLKSVPFFVQQQQQQLPPTSQQQEQHSYRFPSAATGVRGRHAAIPTSFATVALYQGAILAAMIEETNLQLSEHAKTFHTQVQLALNPSHAVGMRPTVGTSHGAAAGDARTNVHAAGAFGAQQHPQQQLLLLQSFCNRIGMQYHPNSTLTVYNNCSSKNSRGSFKRGSAGKFAGRSRIGKKQQQDADDLQKEADGATAEEDDKEQKPLTMYLTLAGKLDWRKFRCSLMLW